MTIYLHRVSVSFCILFIFWSLTATDISSGKVRQGCQQHNKDFHLSTFQKRFRKLLRPVLTFISDCFSSEMNFKKQSKIQTEHNKKSYKPIFNLRMNILPPLSQLINFFFMPVKVKITFLVHFKHLITDHLCLLQFIL